MEMDKNFPSVKIGEQQKFDYQFIAARAKQYLGDYAEAEKMYKQLLLKYHEDITRQAQIYNILGVLKRDQGLLSEAIDYQTNAETYKLKLIIGGFLT